jgi:ABC-type dipeptide/oligopeptide/nickel transport system permease component
MGDPVGDLKAHVVRSLLRAAVIMFMVMTIVFVVLRLAPIDPAQFMLGNYATEESLRTLRQQMELDRPIHVQYVQFLLRLSQGDLGRSFINKETVLSQLLAVLPYTVELVFFGTLLGILFGVPPGILSALKPNGLLDQMIRLVTLVGISLPVFVSGIFLISVFSLTLGYLPIIGGSQATLKTQALGLILPAFSCGIWMMAGVARLTRASLLDVLAKGYIVTARSKGLRESFVVLKHAMRNALLPLVTFLGINISILLGAAVLVEVVFTRPGVGRLIVEGITSGDFPLVQVIIMFYAGAVVLINLAVDLAYLVIDPRIAHK